MPVRTKSFGTKISTVKSTTVVLTREKKTKKGRNKAFLENRYYASERKIEYRILFKNTTHTRFYQRDVPLECQKTLYTTCFVVFLKHASAVTGTDEQFNVVYEKHTGKNRLG